jgi:hypothetical protein
MDKKLNMLLACSKLYMEVIRFRWNTSQAGPNELVCKADDRPVMQAVRESCPPTSTLIDIVFDHQAELVRIYYTI